MPIRERLTLFNALVIGVILLGLGFALFFFVREALLSRVEDTVSSRALAAAKTVNSGEALDQNEIQQLTLDGVFVIVRDGDGQTLTQTVDLPTSVEDLDTLWSQVLQSGQAAKVAAGLDHFRRAGCLQQHVIHHHLTLGGEGLSYTSISATDSTTCVGR